MSDERYGTEEEFRREAGRSVGDDGTTPVDEALEALAHPVRRSVVYSLREREAATIDEIARAVAAERTGSSPDDVSPARRDRVKSGLVHAHLPKLHRSEFVEYDRRDGAVSYAGPPEPLEEVVDQLARFEE